MPRLPCTFVLCLALAGAAGRVAAQPEAAPRQPLWELGLFGITGTQLAYPGSAQRVTPTLVLPYFIYRGPLLRADQGTVGLRAAKTATTELDIGFAGSFGSAASDNRVRRGMPDIGTLVEFGPRLRIDLGEAPGGGRWGAALPLRGVFDLSDGLRYRGITFEPSLTWSRAARGGWRYGVTGSVLLGNERIADTFYAVDAPFVTATRPAYDARSGLMATRLAFSLARSLGADWRAFGYVRLDSVAGAANRASPLVERRDGVSAGVGLAWTWMRSEQPAAD
jgi:outer membrane scaffolding protein for murein synthesis (MipA/OmpV family)